MSHFPRLLFRFFLILILFFVGGIGTVSAGTVTMQSNKVWGPTNGLVGMWTFNGPDVNWTTNTVIDRSGQGNNGIMINMATKTSPTAGKLGQALKFNNLISGTGQKILFNNHVSLDNILKYTISFWAYPQQGFAGNPKILDKATWFLSYSKASQNLTLTDYWTGNLGMWNSPSKSVPLNRWTHVVLTYDRSSPSNIPIFYINGIATTTQTVFAPTGSIDDESSYFLYIGGDANYPGGTVFNGSLDDFRIYNRILTPTEITQLYHAGQVVVGAPPKVKAGSGLVGWWTFNGPDINWTTNTALDRSGQGNNGTISNMSAKTSATPGKLGQALKFDGVDDSIVSVSNSSAIASLTQATVAFWVYRIGTTEAGYFTTMTSDVGGNGPFNDGIEVSSNVWYGPNQTIRLAVANTLGGSSMMAASNSTLPLRTWTHVAVVWNGSLTASQVKFYFNGVDVGTNALVDGSGSYIPGDGRWKIGMLTGGNGRFNGTMDDVRIYNRALSAQEVKQLAGNGLVTISTCGRSTVKDADGNVYNTVQIGKQCWMKQNMRVGTRINVSGNQTNNAVIEKYCYNDTLANCMTNNNPNFPDGGLYQWDEAMQYSATPGARGICPSGWHIPTHDQWTILERAVCTSGSCATDFPYDTSTTGYRGTNEGTKLKPNGTSGFEGNLAGYSFAGSFGGHGSVGHFWSSLASGGNAWRRYVGSASAQVFRGTDGKSDGLSVRCLKD